MNKVLEMCFGGDCGCVMEATTENSVMEFLFNEELGLVVQVPARVIAKTQVANRVKVSVNGAVVDEDEKALDDLWEATSGQGTFFRKPTIADCDGTYLTH